MTASICRLLRRAELADITKFRHLFFLAVHLTRSRVTPMQLYARCVSKDSAVLVHARCRKKEIVDWNAFLAVTSYESCKAMSETSPYPAERPLAVQMSSAMTDAISDAFLRRSRLRCTGLASPGDARKFASLREALENASSSGDAKEKFLDATIRAQVGLEDRMEVLKSEERMTPEVTTDAEQIKSLIMMGQGPYCLKLPCMDDVTQMIVDYINGRKHQSELESDHPDKPDRAVDLCNQLGFDLGPVMLGMRAVKYSLMDERSDRRLNDDRQVHMDELVHMPLRHYKMQMSELVVKGRMQIDTGRKMEGVQQNVDPERNAALHKDALLSARLKSDVFVDIDELRAQSSLQFGCCQARCPLTGTSR
eukprot:222853-Prymnesium_polylepis.1